MPDPDLVLAFRKISRHACMRIAKASFTEARNRKVVGNGAGRVTAVHKPMSCG